MCDFDEKCKVLNADWVRARKQHECHACYETIRPGDRYHRVKNLFEDQWWEIKRCARCYKMWSMIDRAARDAGEDGAYALMDCGYVWSDIHDSEPPIELQALAFALPGEVDA